jgi:hypothetical protein
MQTISPNVTIISCTTQTDNASTLIDQCIQCQSTTIDFAAQTDHQSILTTITDDEEQRRSMPILICSPTTDSSTNGQPLPVFCSATSTSPKR